MPSSLRRHVERDRSQESAAVCLPTEVLQGGEVRRRGTGNRNRAEAVIVSQQPGLDPWPAQARSRAAWRTDGGWPQASPVG